MKLTLLVENNPQLEQFYTLNLQTWVGAQIECVSSADVAPTIIDQSPNLKLIIVKAKIGEENSAQVVLDYLQSTQREDVTVIVIGGDPASAYLEAQQAIHFPTGLEIKPLLQACAKILEVTAIDMAKLDVPDFFSIPISFFYVLKHSVTDIYEQVDNKYQLKLNEFEDFDVNVIDELRNSHVNFLYVKKQDRLKFVTNVTQELVAKIDLSELDENEKIHAIQSNQKLLHKKLSRAGITEETVELAQKNLKSVMSTVKKYPRLKRLMARLLANKSGYLYKHIQVLTFIGVQVMEFIDWGNDEQKDKFAFIAFFHDILLETDEQAQIRTNQQLKASSFDKDQQQLINTHAQKAAELVGKYPHAPMGVDTIIRQHHGVTHGVGFSETYGGNLSPMAVVFILAEEFTGALLEAGDSLVISTIISNMREKYPTQRFQKIIDAFEKLPV